MVLRLKTRESRSLPGLRRGEVEINPFSTSLQGRRSPSGGRLRSRPLARAPPTLGSPHTHGLTRCPPRCPIARLPPHYICPMARTPKDTTPRPRPSRGKSGKPPAPPAEGLSGTPETKRSARSVGEAAHP